MESKAFFCGSCDLEVVLFLQGDYFTLPFGLKVKLQIPLIYPPARMQSSSPGKTQAKPLLETVILGPTNLEI